MNDVIAHQKFHMYESADVMGPGVIAEYDQMSTDFVTKMHDVYGITLTKRDVHVLVAFCDMAVDNATQALADLGNSKVVIPEGAYTVDQYIVGGMALNKTISTALALSIGRYGTDIEPVPCSDDSDCSSPDYP